MNWFHKLKLRLLALLHKRKLDAHMDDEMRSHIEMQTQENIEAGMKPEDARYAASRQFGWVESIKDFCREQRGVSWIENLGQDIRYGARMLRKNPGFTAVAVLSLALSIGAGTAIFSLFNAILLGSLPVPNPNELRLIKWSGTDWESNQKLWLAKGMAHSGQFLDCAVSLPVLRTLREQCFAQADIFGYCPVFERRTLRARHEAIWADGLIVSGNFFSGLGLRPSLGRLLDANDEHAGAAPSVVISYRLWKQQFDLDPGAIGQSVTIGTFSFAIVGVLPQGFAGVRTGAVTDFYVPLSAQPQLNWKMEPDSWCMALMARLKPGVSDAQFQSTVNVAFARESQSVMKNPKVWITAGRGGTDEDRNRYGGLLLLLLGVVGVVLLVACANVAGLMLARGAARQHEFAVCAALGAGCGRLLRQSLTESVLVASLGGGLGLVVAIWGKTAIGQLLTASADGLHYDTSLDFRVLSVTLVTSLVTALLSGLWPALRAAGVEPLAGLKDRGTFGPSRLRAGRFLVAAQITLSLFLLGGAGLFIRTLVNLTRLNNIGYAVDHLLVFKLQLYSGDVNSQPAFAFFDRVRQSLAAVPGVRSAAFSAWPSGDYGFQIPGDTSGISSPRPAHVSFVSEAFFTAMGIPILLGEESRNGNPPGNAKVAVVNETFVRKYLAGRNPIGLTIKRGDEDLQIIGVCRDAKYMDMDMRRAVMPMVHFSSRQMHPRFARFVLRTALSPLAMTATVRKAVAAIDPDVPLIDISTQEQVRDAVVHKERTLATLCGSLAVFAVLLSAIGLYGLLAYQVARRTGEIGVRQALGATKWQIAGPILRESLVLAGIGVVIGTPITFALTLSIRNMLYGVGPADPFSFCGAAILFFVVALIASWIPARRAAKVDPMEALRYE